MHLIKISETFISFIKTFFFELHKFSLRKDVICSIINSQTSILLAKPGSPSKCLKSGNSFANCANVTSSVVKDSISNADLSPTALELFNFSNRRHLLLDRTSLLSICVTSCILRRTSLVLSILSRETQPIA